MFSNYSVKKIMPRLVIVAIAVNLSFYICAALVDLSNILGANLREFITNIGGSAIGSPNPFTDFGDGAAFVSGIVVTFLAGVATLILVAMNFGTVFVGFLLILAVLAFREVLVTILIIISPLAFVLYLLPNTDKYFKKWATEFTRCLFIYPAIAAVWGAAQLVTFIIMGGSDNWDLFKFVMVCLIQLVPVATILPIMKMGGQALSQLQGLTQKGLDKTGLKEMGNAGGQLFKDWSGTKLANSLRKPPELNAKGQELKKANTDAERDIRRLQRQNDKKETTPEQRAANDAKIAEKQAAIEKNEKTLKDKNDKTYYSSSGSGAFSRGLGHTIGFVSGLGDGNLRRQLEGRAEKRKGATDAAIRTDKAIGLLEVKLKTDQRQIDSEVALTKAKLLAEGGVRGTEYRKAELLMKELPGNAAAAAQFDAVQKKLVEEERSNIANNGQIMVNGKAQSMKGMSSIEIARILAKDPNAIDTDGDPPSAAVLASIVRDAASTLKIATKDDNSPDLEDMNALQKILDEQLVGKTDAHGAAIDTGAIGEILRQQMQSYNTAAANSANSANLERIQPNAAPSGSDPVAYKSAPPRARNQPLVNPPTQPTPAGVQAVHWEDDA
jgi:hypothetical protein